MVGVLLLGLAVAGCSTAAHFPGTFPDARGAAIAFESIEGPPPHLVHRIVRDLTEEAAARQIAVVPRGGPAAYRIRGYLAAHAAQGTTSIAWAWDIYDAGQRRAFRLTGEDKTTGVRRSWAAADDQALRRIARASMDQLVVFISGARAPPARVPEGAPAEPQRAPSIIAGLDDFRPEAAGIFRIFRREPAPEGEPAATAEGAPAEPIPLPRERPIPPAATPAALAFTR